MSAILSTRVDGTIAADNDVLSGHLLAVARERCPKVNPVGHAFVRDYVEAALGAIGDVARQCFVFGDSEYYNLLLRVPGRYNLKPLLVGAHFDGMPRTPGADDNATAISVLIELAAHFARVPARRPIVFAAFDLEEQGLVGSRHCARLFRSSKQQLALMISLEMLGYCDHRPGSQKYPAGLGRFYPPAGDFIALIGNLKATPSMIALRRRMSKNVRCEWLPVPLSGVVLPATRRSDHAPFWDHGYPALMITDTADLRNPNYHRPTDTLETLDMVFLKSVFRGLQGALAEI
jgi:Peptidase family M28